MADQLVVLVNIPFFTLPFFDLFLFVSNELANFVFFCLIEFFFESKL